MLEDCDPALLAECHKTGMRRTTFAYLILVKGRGMSKAGAARAMGLSKAAVCRAANVRGDYGYSIAGLVAQIIHQARMSRDEHRLARVKEANRARRKA